MNEHPFIRIGGKTARWTKLSAWREAPPVPGVYAIGLMLGVRYERSVSRIVYIGSCANLRLRLSNHNRVSHNSRLNELKARFPDGFLATFVPLESANRKIREAYEDAALQDASREFGCYPICNQGRIDSPLIEQVASFVEVGGCEELPYAVSLGDLCRHLRCDTLGKLLDPVVIPDPLAADTRKVSPKCVEQIERPASEFPVRIQLENVACWSIEKMRAVISQASNLFEVRKRKRSNVMYFGANSAKTPRPLTWGEVALVKGRMTAGRWLPPRRVWIKLVFEETLLGQAVMYSDYFFGEDISKLPQTRKRPSIDNDEKWRREREAIADQIGAEFVAPPPPELKLPMRVEGIVNIGDHFRLLEASHAMDVEVARRDADWARERAIEQGAYFRPRAVLFERIEARFVDAFTHFESVEKETR